MGAVRYTVHRPVEKLCSQTTLHAVVVQEEMTCISMQFENQWHMSVLFSGISHRVLQCGKLMLTIMSKLSYRLRDVSIVFMVFESL